MNGSLLRTVPVAELRTYGGTTFEDLGNLEVWRLALGQMLHAKMAHMLFNVACLLLLGNLLERAIGPWRLLCLWLVAGGVATAISPVLVEAPWNVGSGASQAIFAFAGCAAVLAGAGLLDRRWTVGLVALALGPGLLLDIAFGGYPKPGHAVGFCLGVAFGGVWSRSVAKDSDQAVGQGRTGL